MCVHVRACKIHCRDVTLSSPSSIFKSTQLPQPAKFNAMTFGTGSRPAASNQIPGQIISSYTHFGPAAPQILRGEPKQRIRANFLTAPFEHYHFGNPYAGKSNLMNISINFFKDLFEINLKKSIL